jgi:hypothetical protein
MKYTPANPVVIIFKRDGVVVDFARTANGKVKIYVCHPQPKTMRKLGEGWSSVTSEALRRIDLTQDLQHLLRGVCL